MNTQKVLKNHAEKYGLTLDQFRMMCKGASETYEGQGMNSTDYALAREAYFAGFTKACKEALAQPQPRLFLDLSNSNGNHPVQQEPVAWISVKDRLPSTTQQIEVVFFANPYEWRTGLFTPKGFLREYENNVFQYHQHWGDDKYHTVDNVTHWMPLPEVPKEAV